MNEKLYRVTGLKRLAKRYGGGLALHIISNEREKFAASFPNGPDRFVPKAVLIAWLRSGIDNLDGVIRQKAGMQ